jgi:cytochrome c peroxidase
MTRRVLGIGLLLCAIALPWWSAARGAGDGLLDFSAAELTRILSHGPWPPPWSKDPSNRVSGNPDAAELGEYLFFEDRLSRAGTLSCGTCHVPERDWSDGLARGVGMREVDRNTPNLVNVRYHRWFGWDGAADSLWSQSIRPILNERELAATPQLVAQLLRTDRDLSCRYEKAFGKRPASRDDEALLVDVGKALAAFQETIVGAPTRFDQFRDALARGDRAAAGTYSQSAQRGLRIFVGKGNCSVCHSGPTFSNGEFHSTGVSFFAGKGRVDPGRYEGVKELRSSRFNLLGAYNDDPARATATGTQHVALDQRNFGEFKVPSLRNAALTGPYMHDGRIGTLRDVVRHYSELNVERLHGDGEQILKPLKLTAQESSDLIVFLESVSDYRTVWKRTLPADESACRN